MSTTEMNAMLDSFDRIDKTGPQPLYRQIREFIAQQINDGHWKNGQKLPSENELVEALKVSRMTVNRALRELTELGLVTRVHGLGSFVAEGPRHASLLELRDIADEIRTEGASHRCRVLTQKPLIATGEVASQMQVSEGSQLFYLRAVHLLDNTPIQFEQRYVNPSLMPQFIDQDFNQQTATAYLLSQFKPDEMEHVVSAILPGKTISKQLALQKGEPCLQLSRRTWKAAEVVTWVRLTYPGSRYQLGARYATENYITRANQGGQHHATR